jgi:hypothetical protein
VLLAFPEPDVAAVVDVGEHIETDRRRDVYGRLYDAFPVGPRTVKVLVLVGWRRRKGRPAFPRCSTNAVSSATTMLIG